ncbi:hypothetical protein M1105_04370 [Limibaculum sp. FT325]|uniref:hypothetical protein n=1 Tax=Thermohalobaculum sediminis TaxID=2939436 RepID=UPI0020C13DCE|nr:hypothetical protein [Limibaculum sediminis]MCL5776223.1 hypothetical protein [Limibaculum sediminis]
MRLKLLTPGRRHIDAEVTKVVADGSHGAFVMLPRHADAVVPLPPGVLGWDDAEGGRHWAGHDEAALVKCGAIVTVAAWRVAVADDLAEVRRMVREVFLAPDEAERAARGALARLEVGVMRRLMEMERAG